MNDSVIVASKYSWYLDYSVQWLLSPTLMGRQTVLYAIEVADN